MQSIMGGFSSLMSGVVAIPFLIIAGVFFYLWLRGRGKVNAANDWPSTTGKVLFATVEARRSRSGQSGYSTSYYPKIVYEYEVNGQRFHSDRFNLGWEVGRGWQSGVQKTVERFPVGSLVPVYYNPAKPDESALEKSAPASNIFLFIALLIVAILVCTMVFTLGGMNMISQTIQQALPR